MQTFKNPPPASSAPVPDLIHILSDQYISFSWLLEFSSIKTPLCSSTPGSGLREWGLSVSPAQWYKCTLCLTSIPRSGGLWQWVAGGFICKWKPPGWPFGSGRGQMGEVGRGHWAAWNSVWASCRLSTSSGLFSLQMMVSNPSSPLVSR